MRPWAGRTRLEGDWRVSAPDELNAFAIRRLVHRWLKPDGEPQITRRRNVRRKKRARSPLHSVVDRRGPSSRLASRSSLTLRGSTWRGPVLGIGSLWARPTAKRSSVPATLSWVG